jgi:cysteine synthase A
MNSMVATIERIEKRDGPQTPPRRKETTARIANQEILPSQLAQLFTGHCEGNDPVGRTLNHFASPIFGVIACPPARLTGACEIAGVSSVPVVSNIVDAVGNTPLVRLREASEATDCTILGKAEFMNPGQSVKDRAAVFLIEDALERGAVAPGGVIVEGTAGNTGIGLALVGKHYGLRSVIVIPDTQSTEKKSALRILGAVLVEVPAVPYANPNNYVHYSRRLAEAIAASEPNGACWANQFDNPANRDGHARTTAEEIWRQTGGKIDGFVASVGTGGTLAGVALGLRAKNKDIKIGLADPPGAALFSYYTTGVLKAEGTSITEGIGQSRITRNLEGFAPDAAFQISDAEAVAITHRLLEVEGLCVGASTGVNVAGAIRLAKGLGPGHTIVTILCDHGLRYQSKLFNVAFLEAKDLPIPSWLGADQMDVPKVFLPV